MTPRARKLVISAVFASLLMVLRVVPTFPIIGLPGGRFSAADVMLPLYGVLLGPLQGTLVVILGTTLGFVLRPPAFLFLDFLPPATNTLIVGLLSKNKIRFALLVYAISLLAFMSGPLTLLFVRVSFSSWEVEVPFHWLHLTTLPTALALIKLGNTKENVELITWRRFSGYALLGTMGQHSIGSLLFEFVLGLAGSISREGFLAIWNAVFWIYPIERIILVLVSTIVGVPVIRVLTSIFKEGAQNPSKSSPDQMGLASPTVKTEPVTKTLPHFPAEANACLTASLTVGSDTYLAPKPLKT